MSWWRATLAVCAVCALAVGARTAHADDLVGAGGITTTTLHTPGSDGDLEHFASGGGLSILLLFIDSHAIAGFEGSTTFLTGDDGERLYDLGLSMIASGGMEKTGDIAPYVKAGLDLAASSQPRMDGGADRDVMLGVHGAVGLHGLLGERWVWRAEAGYHGAGVGGVTGTLGLGYIFFGD